MVESNVSIEINATSASEALPAVASPPQAALPPTVGAETSYNIPPYLATKTKAELWKEMKVLGSFDHSK